MSHNSMNICIFDTETTSLDKPFCYNIGYCIVNSDTWEVLTEKDFVVEQVWHNLPLFSTAYYAQKRPIYIDSMRKHHTIMDKYGYICRTMARDFRIYCIHNSYAFNSDFDDRVFAFNCDWFKCNNPFESVNISDIRGFAHNFLTTLEYFEYCERYSLFTESGNYSSTAETYYRYLTNNSDFSEAHTALSDSQIETFILRKCVENGADLSLTYPVKRSLERQQNKTLEIVDTTQTIHRFDYTKIRINKDKTKIILK